MKKILFLLLAVSPLIAMEEESKALLQIKREKLECKKKKLALLERNTKINTLNFLAKQRTRMTYSSEQAHKYDAYLQVGIQDIFDEVIQEFSSEQKQKMDEITKMSRAEEEEYRKKCYEEISQK